MPATPNNRAKQAGHRFRTLREAKQWILRDVEEETRRRFGDEGVVSIPQISRIEKGVVDRVSIDDAMHIGAVLGLGPADVAALYGLWPEEPPSKDPPAIVEARSLAMTLPEDLRTELLSWIEFASMQARSKARERLREREDDEDAPSDRRRTNERLAGASSRSDHR